MNLISVSSYEKSPRGVHTDDPSEELTAAPHLLVVNNPEKPFFFFFLKQYKMSPQADALSTRIMRLLLPRMLNTHFIAFISEFSFRFPLLSKQVTRHA